MTKAAIGLGGNVASSLGNPEDSLGAALLALGGDSVRLSAASRFFRSPAFPAGSGPDYVNAAAIVETSLDPQGLMARLMSIERALGRVREGRWQARTVDLDLLFFGDQVLPDPETQRKWVELPLARQKRETPDRLIVPHPRIQDRAFVLLPLREIAAGWIHPMTGLSVADMAAALPDAMKAEVRPLS